jgi:hypothetical protein
MQSAATQLPCKKGQSLVRDHGPDRALDRGRHHVEDAAREGHEVGGIAGLEWILEPAGRALGICITRRPISYFAHTLAEHAGDVGRDVEDASKIGIVLLEF